MAQKDVPGTKSHENGGPFRPSFSSQGHPSPPPVCAINPSQGHPSRGQSRAPPSRGQPASSTSVAFNQLLHTHSLRPPTKT